MKKIKLFIASSIDGYIATPNGDLEWLTEHPNPKQIDCGFNEFLSKIDTVIMGGHTYRNFLCMDIIWPYKSKKIYVISNSILENFLNINISFITNNVIDEITAIKNDKGSDIALVGGGVLTKMLLQENLIDEMIITTVPVLLGYGIPLFPPYYEMSNWRIYKSEIYENGLLQAFYHKAKF